MVNTNYYQMDSKEARSNSNSNGVSEGKKRRRGFRVFLSCFCGGGDMSEAEARKGSRGKSLAVVPVETSSSESDKRGSTNGNAIVGKKERMKEMNSRKSFKDKSKETNAPAKLQPTGEIITVHHLASHLTTQTEPAPLYRMIDPIETQTQTRMSDSGSPRAVNQTGLKEIYEESSKKNGYGPFMGVCVLTTALAMMVFCGLTLGVICMSVWFSILYMLRQPGMVPEQVGTSENKSEDVDVNSEEYKRRVVLQGFLERHKRKSLKETKGEGA